MQNDEFLVIEKRNQDVKAKLHEALTNNKEYKDHIFLLEVQVQGMKDKIDETLQSQHTPDVLIGHVESLMVLEDSNKLKSLLLCCRD